MVPENSSSFLTPSVTMTLPYFLQGSANRKLPLMRSGSVCILPKFKSGNGAVMDLVPTVRQPHGAHPGIIARQTRVVGDAGVAERLAGVVDAFHGHVGRRHLDHA